ncbi:MAG: hypothetical protein ACRDIV_20925 [Ktedonobacteraceae bacterium]
MQRWKYKQEVVDIEDLKDFLKFLDEAGQKGWELAALTPLEFELETQGQIVIKAYLAILKRPIA